MKHLKWILGLLLLAVVPGMVIVESVGAQRFSTRIDRDETVNGSVYSAGQDIDIRGTINGDIFCAGQTIHIDATVNGDVICTGQDITVSGRVNGDVRAAGQTVAIDANVARSTTVAAQSFSLDVPAKIGQDLTVVGDSHSIKGAVGRDLVINGASTAVLSGSVGRNVTANGAAIQVKNGASIDGNFTYTSGREADVAKNADIQGETERTIDNTNPWPSRIRFFLLALSGMLTITLLLAFLFPRFLHRTGERITKSPGKAVAVGAITAIAAPIVAIGVMILVFGIPLGVLLLLSYLLALVLSIPVAGYYIGRLMLKEKATNLVATALLGTAIIVTLSFIPFIGVFISFGSIWAGIGALVLALKSQVSTGYRPE